jgi:hypothetical protein
MPIPHVIWETKAHGLIQAPNYALILTNSCIMAGTQTSMSLCILLLVNTVVILSVLMQYMMIRFKVIRM